MADLRVILLCLLAVLPVLGCSGPGPDSPGPTPVFLGPTSVPTYEFAPGVHRYVDEDYELVIPTRTPVPTPTPRSVPLLVRSTPAPDWELPALSLPIDQAGDPLDCTSHYRSMLIDYRGRIPFGAEVARSLAEELRSLRPDCVESVWVPEMEAGRVCLLGRVAGVPISPALTVRAGSLAPPQALPTARDDSGNILVHFARLPASDRRGCWYYSASRQAWAWTISGGNSGIDRRSFPLCDALLRDLIASFAHEGFGSAEVARALDEVRLRAAGDCSSPLWGLFPSSGSHDDCGVPGVTGVAGDGSLVVTWHPDYLPPDYAVCWALPAGSGVWEIFYEEDEEE